jgi:RNA polymerase sigma-70 factor (ECF subfamily)
MTHHDGMDHWVGTPLRAAFAPRGDMALPHEFDRLIGQLDATFSDSAFGRDLAALGPRLKAYARSLARSAEGADDLVQDTLLRAWAARAGFAEGTNLRAWTFTILRNLFLNQRRRARFEGEYDELAAETRLARPEVQSIAIEFTDVQKAMGRLSRERREALQRVAIEGMSYEQAAAVMGVSLGSLKSHVSRARVELQGMLDGTVSERPKTVSDLAPAVRRPRRGGAWAAAKMAGRPLWIG